MERTLDPFGSSEFISLYFSTAAQEHLLLAAAAQWTARRGLIPSLPRAPSREAGSAISNCRVWRFHLKT